MPEPWWKSAVAYQIYPRSFADSDGDGVGDVEGIRAHLDHLSWLGVDAVWLSPIFPSPMADFGYDVRDYCDVDPLFGTLTDFDSFLVEAHRRGIRVILDWVPNHTSDQHPWFRAARSSRTDSHRDWYWWRDPGPDGGPPNNWQAAFTEGAPAWTFDEATGQYYLHLFLPEQPDLNWGNPEVVAAMHDVLRFWLDRGVDGFRADVVHAIGKDPTLPDVEPELVGLPQSVLQDDGTTHPLLRDIRILLERYPGDRLMIGEVYLLSTEQIARYHGRGDELHLAFNFPGLHAPWDPALWRARIAEVLHHYTERDAWPTWVLSNHDHPRHRTRYGSEARARAAAVLLLTLWGTPFLYAGEELGLADADVPRDRRVDPGGRDGCRAPIPWTAAPDHGWPAPPWLPFPPDAAARSVEAERADTGSMLWLYRRLIAARRASPALSLGTLDLLDTPEPVVGYRRRRGDDERVVLVNYGSDAVDAPIAGQAVVEVASDGAGERHTYEGRLGGDQAVVLRPG